jgi:hypothetical protein
MSSTHHEPLFFASSDEEDDEIVVTPPAVDNEPASSSPPLEDDFVTEDLDIANGALVTRAGDTDIEMVDAQPAPAAASGGNAVLVNAGTRRMDNSLALNKPAEIIHLVDDESSDVIQLPAISRGFSSTSDRSERSSFSESSGPSERPAKKRRISPIPSKPVSPQTSHIPIPLVIASTNATSKKAPTSIFLGSFVCGNAFSAVKGRGYSAPGEVIHITRDDPEDELPKVVERSN